MTLNSNRQLAHLSGYSELKRRVREALARGRERAMDAVEREKVRTSWEAGKLIHEHILLHKERADYGKQVMQRLANDLQISLTEIRYMVQFARAYPIRPAPGELSWSEYRDLLAINEPKKREALAQRAAKEKWSLDETRSEIKKLKSAKLITVSEAPTEELLIPIKGILSTYRIVTAVAGPWIGQPAIDLGFSNYHRPLRGTLPFHDKEIVRASEAGKLTRVQNATATDLFTYRAYVLEVTDADTLWVLIDLGFGILTQQYLRLRGLDASEIATRDGQQAKRFVESQLKHVPSVIITSSKSDKYDRYLADVFYPTKSGEQFLNNRLLEKKLAHRV